MVDDARTRENDEVFVFVCGAREHLIDGDAH